MLEALLEQRKIPPFKSREEMLDIMQREVYGYLPPKPDKIEFKISDNQNPFFCAGKAELRKVEITCQINGQDFTFPVTAVLPAKEGKHPFFICINFRPNVPDMYIPAEEIIDNGFAIISFCYNDVTNDTPDFTHGLAGILYKGGKREKSDAGKIAMWAWAAQRVMDFAETLDCLDLEKSVVCGHSRLGKTALLTAATDTRFATAFSNDSGCGGAAITRGKQGEHIEQMCASFPYWFSENYLQYVKNEENMPFDQHFLFASITPRNIYVASAEQDLWADPESEMLNCFAVSEIYESFGKKGFVCEDRLPKVNDKYHDGCIGYHLRAGKHFFSREDWNYVFEYLRKHSKG